MTDGNASIVVAPRLFRQRCQQRLFRRCAGDFGKIRNRLEAPARASRLVLLDSHKLVSFTLLAFCSHAHSYVPQKACYYLWSRLPLSTYIMSEALTTPIFHASGCIYNTQDANENYTCLHRLVQEKVFYHRIRRSFQPQRAQSLKPSTRTKQCPCGNEQFRLWGRCLDGAAIQVDADNPTPLSLPRHGIDLPAGRNQRGRNLQALEKILPKRCGISFGQLVAWVERIPYTPRF